MGGVQGMSDMLKPCPFCGVELIKHSEAGGYTHPTMNCAMSTFHFESDGYAMDRWNARTSSNSYEPMLAALKLTKEAVFVLMGPHDFVEINGKEYSGQELFDKIEAAIEAAPRLPAMGGEHE
jgi:hypothetical protein